MLSLCRAARATVHVESHRPAKAFGQSRPLRRGHPPRRSVEPRGARSRESRHRRKRYNRPVIADLDRHVEEIFRDVPGVVAVYIFGSVARGQERPESDVDVAVLFADAPAPTFDAQPYALEALLERRLGRPVEIVVLNRAPVDLRIRVQRDGCIAVDRDPAARLRYEVRTRNEAWDIEPILRRYRQPLRVER